MTVVVILLFSVGVFMLYDGATSSPANVRARRRVLHDAVGSLLLEAGMASVGPAQVGWACAASAVFAAVLAALLVGSPVVGVVAMVAGGYVPIAVVRARRRHRRRAFRECWPEAVDLLAGVVRAGDTLSGAFTVVFVRGPEPIRYAFSSL